MNCKINLLRLHFQVGTDTPMPRKKRAGKTNLVIETAVFMDKSAFDIYVRFYDGDKQKIRNLILAFVNGMQAIYHYPKLRKTIDFTIVRLELLQSEVFSNGGGERTQLLTSFCDYQGKINPGDDTHPEHWDIGYNYFFTIGTILHPLINRTDHYKITLKFLAVFLPHPLSLGLKLSFKYSFYSLEFPKIKQK